MARSTDPAIEALTGSRTRLLTLAVLANATRPLTGYRIASIAGLPRTKVYSQLRWGLRSGLVGRSGSLYLLADEDVRQLLRKRIRLIWAPDWFSEKARRESERRRTSARLRMMPPPRFRRERGWKPRHPEIFRRADEKDETLREMGLRPSSHG